MAWLSNKLRGKTMRELTENQKGVLRFIIKYMKENNYPPTLREIGDEFGYFPKGVFDYLWALRKKGFITWIEKKSRTIQVLKED